MIHQKWKSLRQVSKETISGSQSSPLVIDLLRNVNGCWAGKARKEWLLMKEQDHEAAENWETYIWVPDLKSLTTNQPTQEIEFIHL